MMTRAKVAALRALMKKNKIAAYYIPSVDPHQSEYLPECWKRRHWLSGFTGSAGDLVIGLRKAGLWTDGRYYLQAADELAGSGISLMKMGRPETPEMPDWVIGQLKRGQALGVDPSVISVAAAERFEQALTDKGIKVKYVARNLVDQLWTDRPEPCLDPIKLHSSRYAGETVTSKLKRVREAMRGQRTKVHVIGALDAIAWLLNIRSKDIEYTPVVISYVVVTDRTATLYVDPRKVNKAVERALAKKVKIKPYDALAADLKALGRKKPRVWIDPVFTNRRVVDLLKGSSYHLAASPITAMKAVKNETQLGGFAAAHVRDGVAMVKFLKWLGNAVRKGGVTELSAARRLYEYRAEDPLFTDCSFETISGYAGNGAIIHYAADEKSDTKLKPRGLYLIDSGGQYPDGTTDITRTVALGKPTAKAKEYFTRVLAGTIACTITPFPAGTTGQRHEMFARQALWMIGKDYAHGTGHGVGQYLGVHEGPHSLKNLVTPPLVAGNIMSIEPGHYEARRFGIRIENLAYVAKDGKLSSDELTWLRFHTLTLCPIDRRLIDRKFLTGEQRNWLNRYHAQVYRKLNRFLDREHKVWLRRATKAI